MNSSSKMRPLNTERKILLTGASGFIGSQVLAELLRRGYEVHATVHCGDLPEHPGLTAHQLDLLDVRAVDDFMARGNFTHLLHLAWYVGKGYRMNILNMEWLSASLQLLQSFAQHGGQHFLGGGSCVEYEYKYGFLREDITPTSSDTLYGGGKNSLFRMSRIFCAHTGVRFQWARIFNCYGPGEQSYHIIPSVIRPCLRGKDVRVSDGRKYRDYLHVEDTARGIVDVFESDLGGVVNVCSGKPAQLRTIVEEITELTAYKGQILWGTVPDTSDNAPFAVGDNSRLRAIGWQPKYDLASGLQQTINWWKHYVNGSDGNTCSHVYSGSMAHQPFQTPG